MTVTGNPYGFYPDRTKYPLANLDGQLQPAPHHHVLADIDDYGEEEDPDIPAEPSSWEVSQDGKKLILKETAAVPVSGDTTYKLQLNEGYRGTILYKPEGSSTWVDQFPGGVPTQYPVYWNCPGDGEVRFEVSKADGGSLSTADLDQIGLIFVLFSLSEFEKDFRKEQESELLFFTQTVEVALESGANPQTVNRVFVLKVYRKGHICSLQLQGFSPPLAKGPHKGGGVGDNDTWLYLDPDNWRETEGWEGPIKTGGIHGMPERLKPATGLGDLYVNSDQATTKTLWLNFRNDEEMEWNNITLKLGGMLLWANSPSESDGVVIISSVTYPCMGA